MTVLPENQAALTTVMYHYVRPVAGSAFPRLKALELNDFLGQLAFLQEAYTVISPAALAAALRGEETLPPRPCLLTFDDGYSDHYLHVFPALADRGLTGLFFPPRSSLIDRAMLEVNCIQFILACHPRPQDLADEVDVVLRAESIADPTTLRAAHFTPNRHDGVEVAYVKRLLQHALPSYARSQLTGRLFARHVTADARGFAEALYLSPVEAQEMRAGGMEFGGHGDLHMWHGLASPQDLAAEIAGSVVAMKTIGARVEGGFYCYPFGSENEMVRTAVRSAGFTTGFTVVPEPWPLSGDRLRISRLDTNDLPVNPADG